MSLKEKQHVSLLDEVTINHGPLGLLSEFFLVAERMAFARGVSLSFAPLTEIAEVNRKNRDSWLPIVPVYDPKCWGQDDRNSFGIVGRNEDGEIVATQALRIYDWPNSNFKQEAESLRLFYRNPDQHKGRDECCRVSAAATERIKGRVALSGGIWFRPDYRGRRLTSIMVRLGRAYALGRWNIDYLTAVMIDKVFERGLSKEVGHTNIDQWIEVFGSPLGNFRCKFMWFDMEEMIEDLARFLSANRVMLGSQVDASVGQAHAQE